MSRYQESGRVMAWYRRTNLHQKLPWWYATGAILARYWHVNGVLLAQYWHITGGFLARFWHVPGVVLACYRLGGLLERYWIGRLKKLKRGTFCSQLFLDIAPASHNCFKSCKCISFQWKKHIISLRDTILMLECFCWGSQIQGGSVSFMKSKLHWGGGISKILAVNGHKGSWKMQGWQPQEH